MPRQEISDIVNNMFIPWWGIILGVIVVASIASSDKGELHDEIEELKVRVEELESGQDQDDVNYDDYE